MTDTITLPQKVAKTLLAMCQLHDEKMLCVHLNFALERPTQSSLEQPAQEPRQWVGLTDEDIRPMCRQSWVFETVKQWASIIESKLREKNGAQPASQSAADDLAEIDKHPLEQPAQQEPLITVESSLRFKLDFAKSKIEGLEDEVRELKSRLAAQPAQQAEKQPTLQWCNGCGEGVATFCRGKGLSACPMQLPMPAQEPAGFDLWWGMHMPHAERTDAVRAWEAAQPAQQEPHPAELVCAQAYQVVGVLLDAVGMFDTDKGTHILDNLSEAQVVHDDVLPFEIGPKQETTVEDNSQDWKGMGGSIAFHLIERHADNWEDIDKMMNEWLAANTAPQPQPVVNLTDDEIEASMSKLRDDLLDYIDEYGTTAGGIRQRFQRIARAAIAAHIAKQAQPAQQVNEADELLRNLGLDPDTYRTDGGYINHLKVKAAILHPDEYPVAQPAQEPVKHRWIEAAITELREQNGWDRGTVRTIEEVLLKHIGETHE